MSDLKTEIRAAFENEQAAFPTPVALRRQVVHAVTAAPERIVQRDELNLQWLAVAAAVLVTVAIVAGLLAIRFSQRPVPVRDYGPPPAGVNLIYVADPTHPNWIRGYDWEGHPRATIKLPAPADPESASVTMAPDGGEFEYRPGNGVIYLDRAGRPILPGLLPDVFGATTVWADDSRHFCFIRVDVVHRWTLYSKLPGEPDHLVRLVAVGAPESGFSVRVAACSIRNNQAIVTEAPGGFVTDLWVVRLSDGSLVAHHTYPKTTVRDSISGSADGAYIGEGAASDFDHTVVRRVSDWKVVSTLPTVYQVFGFSGDDTMAMVETDQVTVSPPAVRSLATGQNVWSYNGPNELRSWLAEPGGSDIAVALSHPPTSTSRPCVPTCPNVTVFDPYADIWIVHADGTTIKLPGRLTPLW